MQNPHDQAQAVLSEWAQRFNAGEIEPLAALYAYDALLLGTSSPELYVGQQSLERYFRLNAQVTIGRFEVRSMAAGMLLCAGFYTFVRNPTTSPVTVPARFSFVLEQKDGEWRILHHHSSALPPPRG